MQKYFRIILLFLIIILLIYTAINPYDLFDWALENILTVLFLIFLIATRNIFKFSNKSYLMIFIFLSFHIIGSHYAYDVPFFDYLSEKFDFKRNHYDRLVHFSFGLLLTYPIYEIFYEKFTNNKCVSAFIAIGAISLYSIIYEILEWLTVIIVAPELGSAFLGMQGDIWDAQKDMALALLGSGLMIIFILIKNRIKT